MKSQNSLIKQKLKNGLTSIGSWIMIGNLTSAEILSDMDFEWLVVDMEHTAIGYETLQVLLLAIKSKGKSALVRVENNDEIVIKRVLDCGADGIIVPQVNSGKEAETLIKSAKYPPEGNRGIAIGRASGYGKNFENYFNTFNKEILIFAQIENYNAVENIESIVSIEGLDGIFLGPYDLSGSMGIVAQFDHPKMKEARSRIIKTARDKNIALGIHEVTADINSVQSRIKEGFNFIACGIDTVFLRKAAGDFYNEIKDVLK